MSNDQKQGFDDKSPMPFGKYKGTAMANVPASYLLWVRDNMNLPRAHNVTIYILENQDLLEKEATKPKYKDR